ncbi:TetR/AcrR family transcriptional regulator [Niveibacterium terrae]|uniref:TetR/AcrR family transcriptional regulator n=1 Tax=Niveibacterium terrae TaxID=3373598 RepID=UPI003A94525D
MASNDQKTRLIQDAAIALFSRYGFRKTAMLDIARAAGISRASLYLSFCSKEEVFRSVSIRLHEAAMAEVEAAFAGAGGALERIERALSAFMLGLTAPIMQSPHGQELVDANTALAADITGAAKARLLEGVSRELARAAGAGEIGLAALGVSSDELARMIVSAADGFKHAGAPVASDHPAQLALLMRLLARALVT